MDLATRLGEQIALDGPITVAAFMTACLHDPRFGYYATRPHLGAQGDFITAPMVSQMFGELVGLWAGEVWTRLGRPSPFRFVEIGPGDATLMSDALRALAHVPGFLDAAELWLVEPSAPLRALQAERLAKAKGGGAEPRWAASLAQLPGGEPMILIANEVLDCLPAHQFVRTDGGWMERRVGLDGDGRLVFGLAPPPAGFAAPSPFGAAPLDAAPLGSVLELSPAQAALGAQIGARIAAHGGAALLIDYGRDRPGLGDTLQALRAHRKVDPLETPGEADLTVHADFATVSGAAMAAGADVAPILSQADFLTALGVGPRAEALARARPDKADVIGRQLARLIGADQMGALFKALAIHQKGLSVPGFESPP